MRFFIAVNLIIVGLIHLPPLLGVSGGKGLRALHGIPCDEPNLAILMRHRAVLLGALGVFMIYAAFRPELHSLALVTGLVSVISYLYLVWSTAGHNQHLVRVFKADVIALACLIAASVGALSAS